MPLKTVRVPPELEELFAKAEERVGAQFGAREDDPAHASIQIFGERYVLVRAAALSVEFFGLVRDLYGEGRRGEADDFARNILFDLAHSIGKSDARRLARRMDLVDPMERLTAGPVHFSHTGWAFVDLLPESRPQPDESYYLIYDHPHSFEAESWLDVAHQVDFPVCIMNAGYSSGWCEESFELPLVASEVLCRARGDDACRFIMAHPDHIEARVERYIVDKPLLAKQIRGYQIPNFFSRKRSEEELRRAHAELEARVQQRTRELRHALDRLEHEMAVREQVEKKLVQTAKLEAIGRLAGGIAHDFNNLMGVVIGHTSMLEHRLPEGDPMRQQLREVRQAGEQASGLTRQLLAFSRSQLLRRELVDLNEVVRETSRMLRRLIDASLDVEIHVGQDLGLVRADRGQISQVILNLALNARDAMPDGGTLTLSTAWVDVSDDTPMEEHDVSPGSWVMLSVTDTGIGMDDETLAHAFDPFFTTKDVGKGTGLGLSTVYGIVTQAGGSISVSTSPGEGTRFRVYFPRVDAPPPLDEPTPSGGYPRPQGSETVLVVEDQPGMRRMVGQLLRDLGYDVLEAADPDYAMELAATHDGTVHLVLTDVVMPSLNGRELVDKLREIRPELRVLYMSGYADDDVGRHGLDPNEAELLDKPFSPDELARRVREVLDSSDERG